MPLDTEKSAPPRNLAPAPRRAGAADSAEMAAIHAMAFAGADAWSVNVFDLQLSLPNVFGLLHPASGMILVRVAADEAEILTIVVAPSARRHGIATTLLSSATAVALSLGATKIFLEVSISNIAALQLYTGFGFQQVGRRPRYYSDLSDALVLRFDLAPTL